jgi:hypothetical protein
MARTADLDLIAEKTMVRIIRELSAEALQTEDAEQREENLPNN